MRQAAVAGLAILALAGCTAGAPQERDAVAAVDRARGEALNRRDLDGYLRLLSRDYRDGAKDFAAVRGQLERTFAACERISYRPLGRTYTVSGATAVIAGDYLLKVTRGGQPLELAGREELRLRREPGGWKLVGGL